MDDTRDRKERFICAPNKYGNEASPRKCQREKNLRKNMKEEARTYTLQGKLEIHESTRTFAYDPVLQSRIWRARGPFHLGENV